VDQLRYYTGHINRDGIDVDKTHNHELYILEQPSSCSTSQIRPSWPRCRLRLSLCLVFLFEHASCYHAQPSILLFISMGRVSHLTLSLLSGWLLNNVQVNNIMTLHDTHGHIYTSHRHYYSSLLPTLLPLSLAGRLIQTLLVWWQQTTSGNFDSNFLQLSYATKHLILKLGRF
jgi:hypothetical protein